MNVEKVCPTGPQVVEEDWGRTEGEEEGKLEDEEERESWDLLNLENTKNQKWRWVAILKLVHDNDVERLLVSHEFHYYFIQWL